MSYKEVNIPYQPQDRYYLSLDKNFLVEGFSTTEDLRLLYRRRAQTDLYFLAKYVLKYRKLTWKLHRPLCQLIKKNENENIMVIWPGDHFKTTIAKSFVVNIIINDPNERILFTSASEENAGKFLNEIQQHVENNATLGWLFPEIVPPNLNNWDRWNKQEMMVPRSKLYPEATIETLGILGNVTGRHYSRIVCTDLIDKNIADSDVKTRNAVDTFGYFDRVIEKDNEGIRGTIFYEGNRWRDDDICGWVIDNDCKSFTDQSTDEHRQGNGRFVIVQRSAHEPDDSGIERPIFPERYSMADYEWMKEKRPRLYACQYMNRPDLLTSSEYKKEWIGRFQVRHDGVYRGDERLCHRGDLRFFMSVDPAISEDRKSARSAIVVSALEPSGLVLIFEDWAERVPPNVLLDQIIRFFRKYNPVRWSVETVQWQKAIKFWLFERVEKIRHDTGVRLRICEDRRIHLFTTGNIKKDVRIAGLQPYFSDERILCQDRNTNLMDEYNRVLCEKKGGTKDVLDALAQGPSIWDYKLQNKNHLTERRSYDYNRNRDAVTGY